MLLYYGPYFFHPSPYYAIKYPIVGDYTYYTQYKDEKDPVWLDTTLSNVADHLPSNE